MFGVSGNLMSLGALDFGLIVDGAVIIVEAVMHQLSHSKKFNSTYRLTGEQMDAEVNHSASKMMNSAVFGQIIILVVYLPIFTLQGIEGKMFKPMAMTFSFALVGAMIFCFTYVPVVSSLFLKPTEENPNSISSKLIRKLNSLYLPVISWALKNTKKVLYGALGLLFFIN